MRLYEIEHSTNVDRVRLALAHKGLRAERIVVPGEDRTLIREVSGQELVPVVDWDGEVLIESMAIVAEIERRHPEPPLYPADPARRAEVEVFVDWFNRVWKVAPNAIEAELREPSENHAARVAALAAELSGSRDVFEALLDGRDHLLGDDFGAADVCAFPFLRYAVWLDPGDSDLFHKILHEQLALDGAHPRLEAWIRRVGERPLA